MFGIGLSCPVHAISAWGKKKMFCIRVFLSGIFNQVRFHSLNKWYFGIFLVLVIFFNGYNISCQSEWTQVNCWANPLFIYIYLLIGDLVRYWICMVYEYCRCQCKSFLQTQQWWICWKGLAVQAQDGPHTGSLWRKNWGQGWTIGQCMMQLAS
jgi:hypothetical protein